MESEMCIPWDSLLSPCPSNFSLNRVAPLTFLGNVNIAVKFLYYLLPFDLILANHGSLYRKF